MSALPRSYLFVPGNRPDRFDKAIASGADAVILDPEDAVPAAEKAQARAAVAQWLRERCNAAVSPPCLVRINASGTPQPAADVTAWPVWLRRWDGVSTALDDAACVHAQAHRARCLGFGAKLCIHPRQVAPVHEAFAPTPARVDWARRVLAAAAAAGGAAVELDGAMVDRPVILRAQALLAQVR